MSSNDPLPTLRAGFNPLIRPYPLCSIGLTFAATIVGIPLAIVWFCGVGQCRAAHGRRGPARRAALHPGPARRHRTPAAPAAMISIVLLQHRP
ncbi:MAG: hypothetical protein ACJ8GO_08390 [Ramlibacter sp.]